MRSRHGFRLTPQKTRERQLLSQLRQESASGRVSHSVQNTPATASAFSAVERRARTGHILLHVGSPPLSARCWRGVAKTAIRLRSERRPVGYSSSHFQVRRGKMRRRGSLAPSFPMGNSQCLPNHLYCRAMAALSSHCRHTGWRRSGRAYCISGEIDPSSKESRMERRQVTICTPAPSLPRSRPVRAFS
jgi:hypothetical protein